MVLEFLSNNKTIFLIISLIFLGFWFLNIIIFLLIEIVKNRRKFSNRHFTVYMLSFFLLTTLIFTFIIPLKYIIYYALWFLVTVGFIRLVKAIKRKKRVRESNFFTYMFVFAIILFLYIGVFSLAYAQKNPFDEGTIIKSGDFHRLNKIDSLLFSGFTFFSMDFGNFQTEGLLNYFALAEVFTAQIIFITFIGVIAGHLFAKLHLKGETKNE